jgi:uncharacterized phiE125 gp8 family phage protein
MKAALYLAPTQEPVSLEDIKLHCRITENDDDEFLESLIKAAREQVESILHRALITQTWDYWIDGFPTHNYLELPWGKLQSVTSLAYTDSAGTTTTMVATTDYLVDTNSDPGRIILPYGVPWPSFSAYSMNPIKCRFICGYGATAEDVPSSIRAAIKLLVAHLYEQRELVNIGIQNVTEIPFTLNALLMSYRLWNF